MGQSSGFISGSSAKNSLAGKRQITQHNSAELSQPRPNMAAPVHRDTALEIVVTVVVLYR